jgi:hypothetical protein
MDVIIRKTREDAMPGLHCMAHQTATTTPNAHIDTYIASPQHPLITIPHACTFQVGLTRNSYFLCRQQYFPIPIASFSNQPSVLYLLQTNSKIYHPVQSAHCHCTPTISIPKLK